MTSPQTTNVHPPARQEILQAVEQRINQAPTAPSFKTLAHIHEVKQSFRRLIDPGITRPNNRETSLIAIKTLYTLSSNLVREPSNPKFRSFKPTNETIRKRLVNVKGAVEYAVALGFHLKVENLQPIYIFNDRHLEDLGIGNEILKEAVDRETEKQERAAHPKLSDKELKEIARQNVQLHFQEDRLAKQLKDRREAELRAAQKAAGSSTAVTPSTTPNDSKIPQGGITLSGHVEPRAEIRRRTSHGEYSEDEI